ncbi:MAG: GntR family transcriptional regulator [Thermoanaerobaculia bacterium]
MPAGLRIDSADSRPIWRQIEEGLARRIATGGLAPGAALPSVREMARELRVNPNTVVKAYQALAEAGLAEVRRGEGTFVTDSPPALPARERRKRLAEAAERFATAAAGLSAGADEAREAVATALARVPRAQEDPK